MMKLTKSSRAFRRATALVLAAALTLSAPVATNASAATKKVPSLSVKKKTLYYNKAGKKSFTLKVKKNKVKKIVSTKWTTSKKSVAKISKAKKTSVKVTAVKAGSAKIKATVKYKAGSKTKTKKLTCNVTSKKYKANVTAAPSSTAVVTEAPTEVPATEAPATEAPATEVPATEVPATEAPSAEPSAEASETPAASESPAATVANVSKIVAVDPNEFNITVEFLNPADVTDELLKDTKLALKKDSISVTASFVEMKNGNAIFKVNADDQKNLKPGDRSADGVYTVSTDSKVLVLGDVNTVTYEEALEGMAIEGYVTTWDINNNTDANKNIPVANAVVSIKNGESTKTDSNGYYCIKTSSGKKTMTVEAEGLQTHTTETGAVSVKRNHPTSKNFFLEKYDLDKVYLAVTVLDKSNETVVGKEGKGVEGATATLTNSDGVSIKGTVDENGKITFANKAVNGKINQVDYTKEGVRTNFFKSKGEKCTLTVEKKLSPSNLSDVYLKQEKEVVISDRHDTKFTYLVDEVPTLGSMKLSVTYDEDTTVGTKAANADIYNKYQIYYNDGSGNVAKALTGVTGGEVATVEVAKTTLSKNATAPKNITEFNLLNILGAEATLPSGNYYVVVRGYNEAAGTNATGDAVAVALFTVEAGGNKTATVNVAKGTSKNVVSSIDLTKDELASQYNQTATSGTTATEADPFVKVGENTPLYSIDTNGKKTSTEVQVTDTLYQKMSDNMLVLVNDDIQTTSDKKLLKYTINSATGKGTYSMSVVYGDLNVGTNYVVKTDSGHVTAGDAEFAIKNNIVSASDTAITLTSVWNIPQFKLIPTSGDFLDNHAPYDVDQVRLLAADGTAIKTVSGTEAAKITPADSTPVSGSAVYNVATDILKKIDVDYVQQYRLEVTLKGCKPVTSKPFTVLGLMDKTIEITDKFESSTPAVTTLAGRIRILSADETEANAATNATIIVMKDGKIAAVGKTGANGLYSIADKAGSNVLTAGDYTLIIRAVGAETELVNVVIEANKTITKNVDLHAGGNGSVMATVKDANTLKNANGVSVAAYDNYYIDPSKDSNWVKGAKGDVTDLLIGEYEGNAHIGNVDINESQRYIDGLSVGTYTLVFTSYGNQYVVSNSSVTIQSLGAELYPEYTFTRVAEAADGSVKLNVKGGSITADTEYGKALVVELLDENGTVIDRKYLGGEYYGGSTKIATFNVNTDKSYTVKVYTDRNYYVATAKIPVIQTVAYDVTVAFDSTSID